MIGLYLLTTLCLEKDKTVKFGMSMRLEYRWIDYTKIFNDAKYLYYYEFLDKLSRIEILDVEYEILQLHKNERNTYYTTEYFYCDDSKTFHKSIIDVLNRRKIKYKTHSVHDFDINNYDNKPECYDDDIKAYIQTHLKQNNMFTPYQHQQDVLDKVVDFYKKNNIGKIIWSCGLGKALIGILIVQKLGCKNVVIGVPSIYLQKQIKNEILKIFNNHKNILYVGGNTENNETYQINSTTDPKQIKNFIDKFTSECKFIITTYSSSHLLLKHNFDLKIGDEAHHLVGVEKESEKAYDTFHIIKSDKTLFMTATEKIVENKTKKTLYSMDSKKLFGNYIDTKSVHWAIINKKITDYNLIILKNSEDEINDIIDNMIEQMNIDSDDIDDDNDYDYLIDSFRTNKELFLSAFMTLKSIEKYDDLSHVLIYTNTTKNSELVKKYIDAILKLNIVNLNKKKYYNKSLHSNSNLQLTDDCDKDGEITKFKKAPWGIISSVYIFGEGFDCPKLNGVVFGENMESEIRIVQSTLRPNRLDKDFPDKKAYVIIPYVNTPNFTTDNASFDKCRKIIAKIRNVDENVPYKISINMIKHVDKPSKSSKNSYENHEYYDLIENGDELEKIKLRLRHSRALDSDFSEEQDEFNYIQQINKELNIQSKEQYSCETTIKKYDQYTEYIQNPDKYFMLKGVWSNWYDFLGVDTKKFLRNKNDWLIFCRKHNIGSSDEYSRLCEKYDCLPRNPVDFYVGFSSVANELRFNK